MRWIGHDRAALLDGGIQAWTASGRALTRDALEPEPDMLEPRPDDQLWVTSTALSAALLTTDVDARIQVIDARAPERFRGKQEPIDPVAGHIPGALNLPLSGNLDAMGRFLSAAQLHARFAEIVGELPPSRIAHSCGSGVNACHNLLAMELAGLTGSRLYAGSWSEWIQDPARPVALGNDNAGR
jgi:thiosulfate/3-mercaptopyruvate sulfurtransferase